MLLSLIILFGVFLFSKGKKSKKISKNSFNDSLLKKDMVCEIAIKSERYNASSLSVLGQSEMSIEEFQERFTMIK